MEKIGENVKIKKIAVTGIVASGKSTFCDFLEKNEGAYLVKSDKIVHHLYSHNKEIQKHVIDQFGESIVSNGEIDRKKIAKIVFTDEQALRKLENFIHPYIIKAIKESYQKVKNSSYTAFVVEFPLLFELGFDSWFDKTIVVTADVNECRQRFNSATKDQTFDDRLKFQLSQEEKAARADLVIENQGSMQDLENQANKCIA